MTTIGGNNIVYTAENLVGSEGDIIIRTPTSDSVDTFPTASLIYSQFGINGASFEYKIVNNSDFVITNQEGTGLTLVPDPNNNGNSIIQPRTSNDYLIVLTSTTTADVFNLSYNGTPIVAESVTTVINTISPNMVIEDPGVGTETITFGAPDPVPSSYTITMPPTSGSTNQVLTTDGSGIMSWTNSLISSTGSSTDNAIVRWSGTVGNSIQDSNIIIDDSDNITGVNTLVIDNTRSDAGNTMVINTKASGFAAVRSLFIQYETGATNPGDTGAGVIVNIDDTNALGGNIAGIAITTSGDNTANIYGMVAGAIVNPIVQVVGTFENMSKAEVNGSDVLSDFTNDTIDTPIFTSNSDTVLVGNTVKFQEISFLLTTGAFLTQVSPTFEYSTGGTSFASFSPNDNTNGFQFSGVIIWQIDDIPGWVTNTGGNYEIRITRTSSFLLTTPVTNYVQITGSGENYYWNNDGDVRINSLNLPGSTSGSVTFQSPATVTSYNLTLPTNDGNPNQFLQTDGSGILTWADGGGGITSLNGLTVDTQTLATGISGSDFGINSSGSIHTFNLPIASGTNTGKLSNTDWTTFNNKLTSTLPSGDIFVGNGSNVATPVSIFGDATLANTGEITIENNAITTVKILDANVTNAKLANDSVTITAGDGLQNGGSVALGASTTLDVDSTVIRTTGAQSMSGPKTFTDSIIIQDPDTPANNVTIAASTSTSSSYSLTLPVDNGNTGQGLVTDGTGVLSWNNISLYDAVIDPGTGTLEAAIVSGAISIFMRAGVYNEASLTNLPANVVLIGENKDTTIIDLGATSLTLQPGTVGLETDGTIDITNGTNAVSGTGTLFTNLNPIGTNTYILIGDTYHLVSSVTDNTNIVLADNYEGNTITGQPSSSGQFVPGSFRDFTVQNASANQLNFTQTISVIIENVCFLNSGAIQLNLINSTQSIVNNCFFVNSGDDAIRLAGCTKMNLSHSIIKNPANRGIEFVIGCSNVNVDGFNITNCGCSTTTDDGAINIEGETTNNYIQITDSVINHNIGYAVNTYPLSGYVMIQSCTMSENAEGGIDFDGTFNTVQGCNIIGNGGFGIRGGADGALIANVIQNNTLNGIDVTGDNNLSITGCQIQNNLQSGIGGVTGNNVIISACLIQSNTLYGVEVSTGNNVNLTGCQINSNSGGGVIFGGTDNICNGNQIFTNTGDGVNVTGTGNTVTNNFIDGNTGTDIINGGTSTTIFGNQSSPAVTTNFVPGNSTFEGFVRTNTNLQLQETGGGTDTVTIQAPSSLSNYTLTLPVDDGTPDQLLQTDGTGNLSWTGINQVCSIYDSVGGEVINGTLKGVVFNASEVVNTGIYTVSVGSYNNGSTVQFLSTGVYSVSYYIGAEQTNTLGGQRSGIETTIQTSTTGTGSWTTKPGSIGGFYVREQTNEFGTGKTQIINVASLPLYLRITFDRLTGTTNIETKANSSSLSIMKVG